MSAVPKTRTQPDLRLAPSPSVLPGVSTPGENETVAPAASSPSRSLRCPRCRAPLVPVREGELQCTRSARPHNYPIVAGIPDLRVTRDADITVARERADARLLAEVLARVPRNGDVPNEDASLLAPGEAFAEEHRMPGSESAMRTPDEMLNEWQALDQDAAELRVVLDVGCGSGKLLEAAASRWPVCVGVDDNLRRLVSARHRLQQAGVRARLVCANLDALPFADGLFDRVTAQWILERSPRKERALREWNRMLSARGRLWIATSNRWSVGRDPQLGIPTLSWLPMQVLDLWAKWHGLTFPQRALIGTKRLRRLLEGAGFALVRLGRPVTDASKGAPSTTSGRKTLLDLAVVREIAKRVNPVLLAAAGPASRERGRVAFDRYMARLSV